MSISLKGHKLQGKKEGPMKYLIVFGKTSFVYADITGKCHKQKDKSVKRKIVKFASTLVKFIAQYVEHTIYYSDICIHF